MNMIPTLAMLDVTTIALIVLVIVGLVVFGIIISFFSVWLRAWLAGAYVGFTDLVAMRLRQVPYGMVVDARITATKAGISVAVDDIEAHFLAGGNVIPTVQALIAAQKAGISLDWNRACAIDLATKGSGKSVVEAVRTSVDPKVIDCPNPASGRSTIDGVSKDGIQVKVRARVTVRTNLDRFVGGAKEDTIIARVGEGIVTTIGSTRWFSRARTRSPRSYCNAAWMSAPPSKSSRSTSLTWTSARTSELNCRKPRPRPTRMLPKPRPKSDAPPPLPWSRKWLPASPR
jgi:uncharacterized protein YqfA (UPF0365 family)